MLAEELLRNRVLSYVVVPEKVFYDWSDEVGGVCGCAMSRKS
jgi:hypothetical protein